MVCLWLLLERPFHNAELPGLFGKAKLQWNFKADLHITTSCNCAPANVIAKCQAPVAKDEFRKPGPEKQPAYINITAAWAVDREFVIYSFLGVVGPMVTPGSPDALGGQKH